MLQGVRDNLKGVLAIVVVLIFIVPMVISGVGSDFLGGVAGTDAATVNGAGVSKIDLDRAVRQQRDRLINQSGVDAADARLSEEVLRPDVLDSLIRREALVTNAQSAGMAVSDSEFSKILQTQTDFFTDGKFDQQKYRNLLGMNGYTTASFKKRVVDDLLIQQQMSGLQASSFSTKKEIQQIVALIEQQRSFWSIKIPRTEVEENIAVNEDQIQEYYESNQERFSVPEKVKIQYLELTVDGIANSIAVDESDIRAQYETEIQNFSKNESYDIAHILFEDAEDARIAEFTQKLETGTDFAELADEYSDDIATSLDGGNLGVLVDGVYPENFEEAVFALNEGAVSEGVKTDDGLHFIKLIKKYETDIPEYDNRKEAIRDEIALVRARDEFAEKTELVGELTFSSDGLTQAANELAITVQESSYFDRQTGSGIANEERVRSAAFDPEVLQNGHNSNVIELGGDRVVVLRTVDRQEAYVKSIEEVKSLIELSVKTELVTEALTEIASGIESSVLAGAVPKEIAEKSEYAFEEAASAKRQSPNLDPELVFLAFQAEEGVEGTSFVKEPARDGGFWLIGVTEVIDGNLENLGEQIVQGYSAQLTRENINFEGAAYEAVVLANSKVEIN